MLMKMYCVYDSKAATFGVPFCSPRRELAMRSMVQALGQGGSTLAEFPEDFSLFELGEFDDQTGVVKALPPDNLGPVSQWKGNGHG